MACSSILVFAFLFVAPCASLKMKTEEALGELPKAVNCLKSSYYGIQRANSNSCWIYHHYQYNNDGKETSLPEVDGFMDTTFRIDSLSDTVEWKVHRNQWQGPRQGHFMAETADGSSIECGSTWVSEPMSISHCLNGAEWQAARYVESKYMNLQETRHELKAVKRDVKRYKKAAQVVGKKYRDDEKQKLNDLRNQLKTAKQLTHKVQEAEYKEYQNKVQNTENAEKAKKFQDKLDKMDEKRSKTPAAADATAA